MTDDQNPAVDETPTCPKVSTIAASLTTGSSMLGPGIPGVWEDRCKRKRGPEEDGSEEDDALGSPTDGGHEEPTEEKPPEKKAKLVELTNNKELPPVDTLVAGLQVRNRMELDRQEIIQNPN
ncbi:hypothetical protein BDR26DRAFT_895628 [Obelidium mucronatum]|nr:hypothetical protein BDR26DRAFT_895628 [Obelidium mucronatum]